MPTYFLDTDVCVDLLRGRGTNRDLPPIGDRFVSAITAAELWTGIEKSIGHEEHLVQLIALLEGFQPLPFDADAARLYGSLRADLEKRGQMIGPLDMLIAAHARSRGATLITGNLREYRRVPGLRCLEWPVDGRA